MSTLIKLILGLAVLLIVGLMFWNNVVSHNNNMNSIQNNSINQFTDGSCEFPGLGQKCMMSCNDGYVVGGNGECDTGICCKKENKKT